MGNLARVRLRLGSLGAVLTVCEAATEAAVSSGERLLQTCLLATAGRLLSSRIIVYDTSDAER